MGIEDADRPAVRQTARHNKPPVKLNKDDAKSAASSDDYANGYDAGWNLRPRQLPTKGNEYRRPSTNWAKARIGPDSAEQTRGQKWFEGYDEGLSDRKKAEACGTVGKVNSEMERIAQWRAEKKPTRISDE